MYCRDRTTYTIKMGDSLYKIAQRYNTTIQTILSENPNVNPYNLQIGSVITICPNSSAAPHSHNVTPPAQAVRNAHNTHEERGPSENRIKLSNAMRTAWTQHVMWTRMFIISVADDLNDINEVTARLLRNPNDIGHVFGMYYPETSTTKIASLITEHLMIGAELIKAIKNSDKTTADDANMRWYLNADKIAVALNSINPNYNLEDLRKMLYTHLDLTKQEVAMRFSRNYAADIAAYDNVEREALSMADYFVEGIVKQFPNKF